MRFVQRCQSNVYKAEQLTNSTLLHVPPRSLTFLSVEPYGFSSETGTEGAYRRTSQLCDLNRRKILQRHSMTCSRTISVARWKLSKTVVRKEICQKTVNCNWLVIHIFNYILKLNFMIHGLKLSLPDGNCNYLIVHDC